MRPNRKKQVLEHIVNHGGITRAYGLAVFHIQNLADIVMQLRRMNWPIKAHYFKREDGVTTVEYYLTDSDLYMSEFMGELRFGPNGRYVSNLSA